jgi:hypothetical protein
LPTFNDLISYLRLAWSALFGVWKFFHRNKRSLTASEKLALRDKWKPQFTKYLADLNYKKLRGDVIIRDMKRIDTYPEISEGKGISAWFRVGLIDSYERGIMVGLRWEGLMEDENGLRYTDWAKNEKEDHKVVLTGFIPYENIESVDWDGDRYYSYPHIYCYFSFKKEPYEKIMFCTRGEFDGSIR